MRYYKYELILKETIIDDEHTIEEPLIKASTIIDNKTLNGFSTNYNMARIHVVRRLFAELLKKLI